MRHEARRWRSRFAAVGGLVLLAIWITGCTPYVLDVGIAQERLDVATPPLDGSHTITQSFVSRRPNLCEIELLPAVYETPGQGTLTLRLHSPVTGDTELARQSVDVAHIHHNVPLRFTFGVQLDSAGKAYELLIEGSPGVRVGFWYNNVNAYGEGQLELDGASTGGDLRFVTHSRYDLPVMAREVAALLGSGRLAIALIFLLLLPGYALWHGLNLAKGDEPITNLGLSVAVSLAIVPFALLWSTVFGLRWERSLCLVAFVLLALCALARLFRTQFRDLAPWTTAGNRRSALAAMMLFALTLLVRLVQIRNLALPAWVDSPQHVLVTELVAMHGQVPQSYEPLLPVNNFIYHFGFHADTTLFHWLSGLAIPQAMLILGQVLNAAGGLMAYLLALRLTRRKVAAIVAALVVGLVSYMPAYYVSWGRYTQLTGLLLLPAALVTAMDWLEAKRRDHRLLLVAGLLQAGLFLTHARVTVFGACFLATYLLYESLARGRRRNKGESFELWGRAGLLALLTLGLSAPWLVQVISGTYSTLRAAGRSLRGDPSYNAFPWGFLFITRNRELMALAAVGAVWGLLRRKKETILVLAWCGLVALVVNPGLLGLPTTNLVNNATAVIALFLPLAVLDGQAIMFLWDHGPPLFARLGLRWGAATAVRATLLVLAVGVALWSAWGMVSIVNPATVLATAEDLSAMNWIKENTPLDAVFLINTRYWQLGTYVGTDGGYWIPQLTGRRTLLPALSYTYGAPDYVRHITDMARVVSELKDADGPELQDILEQEGVTHVYVGARGGPLAPQMLLGNSHYRPVYSTGAVWIFEIGR
jgi:hypothetical protein